MQILRQEKFPEWNMSQGESFDTCLYSTYIPTDAFFLSVFFLFSSP